VAEFVSAISVPASSQLISPAIFTCQGNKKIKQLYGNCDFELKNGSGFWDRGFIAGARFEPTTLLSKGKGH